MENLSIPIVVYLSSALVVVECVLIEHFLF